MVILGGMHTTSCWSTTTKATIFFGSVKQWFELINYVSISGDSNPQKKNFQTKNTTAWWGIVFLLNWSTLIEIYSPF